MQEDPLALLPEGLLLTGAVVGLLVGLWTPRAAQGRVAMIALLACLGSLVAAAVALAGPARAVFDGTWAVDGLTGVVRLTVAVVTAGCVLLLRSALAGHRRETEAYVLLLLAAVGADALAASDDLLLLVAAYLLAGVPLYALAGFTKDARAVEATLKYYLMGALLGVLMLVGVTALVLAGGGTHYGDLAVALPQAPAPVVALGALGVLAGVAFTAGAVPVHFWVPDVSAGTTPAAAAFITTVPKVGAVAAAYRLVAEPLREVDTPVVLLVAVLAAASMTLGNLAALRQQQLLRLLGYSTVSQVGYLLMAAAVGGRVDLAEPAVAVYLAGYGVTNLGVFAAAAALPRRTSVLGWAAASRGRPWLVVSLVVCLLGLVGTPPTAVFVGKLLVFSAAADGGLLWLVVLAAANTAVSLVYYLRWFAPAARVQGRGARAASDVLALPVLTLHACAVAVVGLGLAAGVVAAVG